MSDHDSPEEIERDIEQTRANIDRTLTDLQHRLAPNALIDKALASTRLKSALRSTGSGTADMAATLGRVMSSNPVPVLLMAVGVTWLAFSSRSSSNGEDKKQLPPYDPDRPRTAAIPVPPTHVESGRGPIGGDDTSAAGREDPSRSPQYQHVGDPTLRSAITADLGAGQTHSTSGYGRGARAGGSTSSRGGTPLDTRTDAEVTESLKAEASRRRGRRIGERARDTAASVSAQVGHVSETLSHGVERMTDVVKGGGAYESTRNVASRATHAVRQVPTRVGGAYHSAGSFIQENPIIAGALAIALGAALALLLPSTRRERRLIGEASDEVKASVREGLEETVDRAKDVARSATEAAADVVRKEATKVREAVEGGAESVAEEVAGSGRSAVDTAAGARPSSGE
jgi:hypothetical protein